MNIDGKATASRKALSRLTAYLTHDAEIRLLGCMCGTKQNVMLAISKAIGSKVTGNTGDIAITGKGQWVTTDTKGTALIRNAQKSSHSVSGGVISYQIAAQRLLRPGGLSPHISVLLFCGWEQGRTKGLRSPAPIKEKRHRPKIALPNASSKTL